MSEHGQLPDFKSLSKRLMAYGLVVFAEFSLGGEDAVVPGTGLSVEDFVAKVLLEYATGKIKHQKSRGSLMTVLSTAMRNDIIDALRKKSHELEETRATITVDEDSEGKTTRSRRWMSFPNRWHPIRPRWLTRMSIARAFGRLSITSRPSRTWSKQCWTWNYTNPRTSPTRWEPALPIFKTEKRSCAGGCVKVSWFTRPRKKAERYETSHP